MPNISTMLMLFAGVEKSACIRTVLMLGLCLSDSEVAANQLQGILSNTNCTIGFIKVAIIAQAVVLFGRRGILFSGGRLVVHDSDFAHVASIVLVRSFEFGTCEDLA